MRFEYLYDAHHDPGKHYHYLGVSNVNVDDRDPGHGKPADLVFYSDGGWYAVHTH